MDKIQTSALRMIVLGGVSLACALSSAETLTVAQGETVTLTADAAYETITVSGTLAVEGAVVSTPARLSLVGGTVRLGTSARLEASGIDATGDSASVAFAGGRLVTGGSIASDGCSLSLAGDADGDVLVDWNCASWTMGFVTSNGGEVRVSGSGNCLLTVRNAGVTLAVNATSLAFGCSGRIELQGGKFGLYKDVLPSDGELFVAGDATLELGGWMKVRSLTGVGRVVGESNSQVTLDVPSGCEGLCLAQVSVEKLVKTGAGLLNALGTMPSDFAVEGGTVRAMPRADVGYSQYRLKVDGVTKPKKIGMSLAELAFFRGDEDVTAGFVSTGFDTTAGYNGGKAFDGDQATKWWFTYDDTTSPSFEKAWVEVSYPERRVVTGYRLQSSDSGGDVPTSWRLYGRDADGEWELLDQRTDEETAPKADYAWSPEYAIDCGRHPGTLSCASLALAKGTTLAAPDGTKFVCAAVSDKGASFDFAAGATAEIGGTADGVVDSAVGSGAFVKTGTGALTARGAATPVALTVRAGALAFETPLLWKQWKLSVGDVYDLSKGEVTFGEFALFDAAGNRLNASGSATLETVGTDGDSFGASQNKRIYDGDLATQGWIESKGLDPADESTWKSTSCVLAETAPGVASYLLATAGYVANGRPTTWKLFARPSSSDAWVEVDSQVGATSPTAASAWYNGGTPWTVASSAVPSEAAFPATTPVAVCPNATLDLTMASRTEIGHLLVDGDATGAGVIVGGSFASAGTLALTCAGKRPSALPLVCQGTSGAQNLANWTVTVNGRTKNVRLVRQGDGTLALEPHGFALLVR